MKENYGPIEINRYISLWLTPIAIHAAEENCLLFIAFCFFAAIGLKYVCSSLQLLQKRWVLKSSFCMESDQIENVNLFFLNRNT